MAQTTWPSLGGVIRQPRLSVAVPGRVDRTRDACWTSGTPVRKRVHASELLRT
ncbi:hypothetical protein ACFOZ7_00465 [Natribaculum luteum]|uniref:Uncharacterized protein n=1 Tax=Natribaculum luteum TaxID=1586232 RepID=A0ABD5NU21_9EURY|nr:hypothetical protein [Natribaculum luteum]